MDLLVSLAFSVGLLGLIALGIVAIGLWRGAPGGRVLLYEVLERQGGSVARTAVASGSRDFTVAVKQCLACPSTVRCGAWLDSGSRQGFESFCPNAGYVSRIRSLVFVRSGAWM
jgi:Family of unknown function (DUF6455)